LLYMLLMLPLGILYFTIAVTGITLSIALMVAPIAQILAHYDLIGGGVYLNGGEWTPPLILLPLVFVVGVFLLFAMLHLARGVGRLQGGLAKNLLVKWAA